jgi:hypothetical protein
VARPASRKAAAAAQPPRAAAPQQPPPPPPAPPHYQPPPPPLHHQPPPPASLGELLRNLGLSQFEAPLAAQLVDLEALALMTKADLVDAGVPIGAAVKMLRAVQQLAAAPAPPE